MLTDRIINSFLLFVLFSLSPLFSSCPDTYAQQWQAYYLASMSPQELQLAANYLYLLYANALADLKVQQFLTPITDLHQTIRKKINTNENPTEELATLTTLLNRLSYVVSTRTIYNEIFNAFMNYYEEHKTALVDATLIDIQLDGQDQLRTLADKQAPTLANCIEHTANILADHAQEMRLASLAYANLSKGNIAAQLSPEDEKNKSLIILATLAQYNPLLSVAAEEVTNTVNDLTDNAFQTISAGTGIYKYYYTILYNTLTAIPTNALYATTLCSMYGALPEEHQSPLPHPDNVFKHMLQTAKLYSSTEIVS
jgi:hypothetical protein